MHETHGLFRPQDQHTAPLPTDGYWQHSPGEAFDPGGGFERDPFSSPDLETFSGQWEFEQDLAQLLQTVEEEPQWPAEPTSETPEVAPAYHSNASHRRRRRRRISWLRRPAPVPWLPLLSLVIAALTALIVAMLSVLGGTIAYNPLRHLATPGTSPDLATWWPLLVYGPWLVASLSILRAALHRRRTAHSWGVVVLFSAIAVVLCVAHAPKTLPGIAVAGLPPVTALVSFHQLIRQITLTSPPRHALPRRRGAGPGG